MAGEPVGFAGVDVLDRQDGKEGVQPDDGSLHAIGLRGAVADQDEALARINNHLKADTCIMIKGSHSTNLDRLVHKILR